MPMANPWQSRTAINSGSMAIMVHVRIAFNEELMSLIRQPGAHHFEAPGWNLLRDVLYVSQ
jgi:hypothetical protein